MHLWHLSSTETSETTPNTCDPHACAVERKPVGSNSSQLDPVLWQAHIPICTDHSQSSKLPPEA